MVGDALADQPANGAASASGSSGRQNASSHGAHKRSSSILSSNSVLSIPSRSSSVALNTRNSVPARSSSIASPTKPGLPTSASDLADTIAGLSLADDADAGRLDGHRQRADGLDSLPSPPRNDAGAKTPIAPTSAWAALEESSPRRGASRLNGSTYGNDREEASMAETAEEIDDAQLAIEDIRKHIFVVQEKRHSSRPGGEAGPSAPSTQQLRTPNGQASDMGSGELDLALMQLDEKLEGVSRSMQQLEVRIGEICGASEDSEEQDADSSIVDKEMLDWKARQRRNSAASMSSLTTFDELMLPSFAPALGPKGLRSRYNDLVADYAKVQQEAEALKDELKTDQYYVVFRSMSDQARSMMDSLDKAIANCQTFVSDFNRDYQAGFLSASHTASAAAQAEVDADDGTAGERDPAARLAQLAEVKQAFTVKKSYYTPSVEQVFQVMELGTKEKKTSNGTMIRSLADQKSRWRQMRERVLRTEKNIKRIEAILQRLKAGVEDPVPAVPSGVVFPVAASASMPALPPAAFGVRQAQQSALGQGSPSRPSLTPKSALRPSALGARVTSGPGRLSNSSSLSSNLSSLGNGTPPGLPPKSRLRRISATAEALGVQTAPMSTPPRNPAKAFDSPRSLRPQRSQNFVSTIAAAKESAAKQHNRSNSAAFPENLALKAAGLRAHVGGSPPDTRKPLPAVTRPSALSNRGLAAPGIAADASRAPPSSYRSSWLGPGGGPATPQRSKTPQPAWKGGAVQDPRAPPLPTQPPRPSSRAAASVSTFRGRTDSGTATEGDSMEWINNHTDRHALASAQGSGDRPGSSLGGSYYRPPSALGTVGDAKSRRRESLIPRLAINSADHPGRDSPSRPGSSLSQASNSTFTSGGHQAALTPPRYTGGASRLSMQTPEPTIMARAQRLNMYARAPSTGIGGMATPGGTPASKRSSRPPVSRANPSLMSGVARSGAAGVGGRTTPLSAAALASLPGAEPASAAGGAPPGVNSSRRSSVLNFRASRGMGAGASVAGGGGGGGRVTPTLSDNGSIGGLSNATWTGVGGQRLGSGSMAGSAFGGEAGRGARIEVYKPNPNDALDVEVAAIANGLGVSLERLDPPLPRGVRLEEGPGKDNRTRYEVGGKEVMCRLLELHRPAGSAGARAGTKTKKILVRVGGGWQDLEQWLLNRLSQQ